MLKLAAIHGVLPLAVLKVSRVQCSDRQSVAGGGFATIYCGRLGNNTVAIKHPHIADSVHEDERRKVSMGWRPLDYLFTELGLQAIAGECLLWVGLDHEHILRFRGISEDALAPWPGICIITPFMTNGDVMSYMKKRLKDGKLPGKEFSKTVIRWVRQLASS